MKRIILLFVMAIATFTVSHAQRLIAGQRGLQLSIGIPITEHKLFGEGNFVCEMAMTVNHKRANQWLFGLEYGKKNFCYGTGKIPAETYSFEGGYLLNLFADARKNVLLNTGLTTVIGYETVNRNDKLLYDGATLLAKDRFVYGAACHLALEVYATDNLVFFVKGKCNVLWNSDVEMFRPQAGTGIRIIF